mgnify:CR=1 FL=1
MADSVFPSNLIDALAMLWLEKQDLSSASPEELYSMYAEARERILSAYRSRQ